MHTRELYRNKGDKTTDLLFDKFKNLDILLINNSISIPENICPKNYFDVIIAENSLNKNICPDVYISTNSYILEDSNFYQKGRSIYALDLSILYCLNLNVVQWAKKAQLILNFPFLTYNFIDNIALNVGLIGNAKKIYSTFESPNTIFMDSVQLRDFFVATIDYKYTKIMKNVKTNNRDAFINTVQW